MLREVFIPANFREAFILVLIILAHATLGVLSSLLISATMGNNTAMLFSISFLPAVFLYLKGRDDIAVRQMATLLSRVALWLPLSRQAFTVCTSMFSKMYPANFMG